MGLAVSLCACSDDDGNKTGDSDKTQPNKDYIKLNEGDACDPATFKPMCYSSSLYFECIDNKIKSIECNTNNKRLCVTPENHPAGCYDICSNQDTTKYECSTEGDINAYTEYKCTYAPVESCYPNEPYCTHYGYSNDYQWMEVKTDLCPNDNSISCCPRY